MKKSLLILCSLFAVFACKPEVEPEKPDGGKTNPAEAPKVVSTTPAANATGVELIDEIVITYDKDISLAPNPTIKVNDQYVDEDIYVVDNSLYIPVTLQGGTKYNVKVLKPSIKDSEGNYAEDLTLTFTTVSLNNFNAAAFALAESPVDASATSEAKALYGTLKGHFGSAIYTAAMAEVAWNTTNAEAIKTTTGSYPAINAFDYIHLPNSPADWIDYGDITPVKEWHDKGGIVSAGWHWNVPTSGGSEGQDPEEQGEVIVDFDDVELDASWTNYAWVEATHFDGLRAGTRMNIYYTGAEEGSQMALKAPVGEWSGLVGEDRRDYSYFEVPKTGDGCYFVILDAGMLQAISENGAIIAGKNIVLTKVGLVNGPESYEEIPIEFEEVEVMWGSGWKYLGPDYFSSLVEGSLVKIYYNAAGGAQMALLKNVDGWPGFVDSNGFNYSFFNIPTGEGHYTLKVDDVLLPILKEYGVVIGGQYYTVTSVTIMNPVYSEKPLKINRKGTEPELSFYSKDNDFKIAEALQEGTWENAVVKADLAKLAGYLKLLQDENIPVLFRPLHEASGGWFWWGAGSAEDFKALWQFVFNYMSEAGVHNLIWVWTSCLGDEDWYPGDNYVDIISYDWYPQNASVYHASGKDAWDILLSVSNKKMLALSECSAIPAPENCAHDGAMWLWAMPWYGESMAAPYNDAAFFGKWMNSQWVITLPQQ